MPAWQQILRFGLEVASLVALGSWAFRAVGAGPKGWLAGLGLPAIAAGAWATFAVPGDRSRSGGAPVPVPGPLRFAMELALFAGAAVALWALGHRLALGIFVTALVVHHLVTPARHLWLLRQ